MSVATAAPSAQTTVPSLGGTEFSGREDSADDEEQMAETRNHEGRSDSNPKDTKSERRDQNGSDDDNRVGDGNIDFADFVEQTLLDPKQGEGGEDATEPSPSTAETPEDGVPKDTAVPKHQRGNSRLARRTNERHRQRDVFVAVVQDSQAGDEPDVADVDAGEKGTTTNEDDKPKVIFLPNNQFETVLRRRAVRKREGVDKAAAMTNKAKELLSSHPSGLPEVGGTFSAAFRKGFQNNHAEAVAKAKEKAGKTATVTAASPPVTTGSNRRVITPQDSRRTLFPTGHSNGPTHVAGKEKKNAVVPMAKGSTVRANGKAITASPESNNDKNRNSRQAETNGPKETTETDDTAEEEVGDVSLGMQLSLLGGRVIVQSVTSLADGRASPAQLTGVIRRGDVLISIDGSSLVDIPATALLESLKPLSSSTPSSSAPTSPGASNSGNSKGAAGAVPQFSRTLQLRFIIGEGLPLLEGGNKSTGGGGGGGGSLDAAVTAKPRDGAGDLFGMNLNVPPPVDQLSGLPLSAPFPAQPATKTPSSSAPPTISSNTPPHPTSVEADGAPAPPSPAPSSSAHSQPSGVATAVQPRSKQRIRLPVGTASMAEWLQQVGSIVATQRQIDRDRFNSEFFTMNEKINPLLRPEEGEEVGVYLPQNEDAAKAAERELEQRLSRGKKMAEMSLGGAVKLFEALETPEKQSRAAAGAATAQASLVKERPAVLVRGDYPLDVFVLVSRGDYFRQDVLRMLEALSTEQKEEKQEEDDDDKSTSTTLSLFFFPTAKMSEQALPQPNITGILYDLAIRTMEQEEEEQQQQNENHGASPVSVPSESLRRVLHFLFEEAIPLWLRSFRPLPWKRRAMMWPSSDVSSRQQAPPEDKDGGDDLSTSVSSLTTNPLVTDASTSPEDTVIEPNLRRETCRLATFYFRRKLLLGVGHATTSACPRENKHPQLPNSALRFIETHGSYLDLYESLKESASLQAPRKDAKQVVQALLKLALDDVWHQAAHQRLVKKQRNSIILYEPDFLSAFLCHLPRVIHQGKEEEQQSFIRLLVSAYPDLQPWQVKDAEEDESDDNDSGTFYYRYLSTLLDPVDGMDNARFDGTLVDEWCRLSMQQVLDSVKDKEVVAPVESNALLAFRAVATKSLDEVLYERNLPLLLDMSMSISQWGLAIQLTDEIASCEKYNQDAAVTASLLKHVETISQWAISATSSVDLGVLQRMIVQLRNLAPKVDGVNLSKELLHMLREVRAQENRQADVFAMIVETAQPSDTLKTMELLLREEDNNDGSEWKKRVTVIRRALELASNDSVSQGSLPYMSQLRNRNGSGDAKRLRKRVRFGDDAKNKEELSRTTPLLWDKVVQGSCPLQK